MIKLQKLIADLNQVTVTGDLTTEITGLAYDSREVGPGDLFVAISGFKQDGHQFISEAIANGAQAIIVEQDIVVDKIPIIKVADTRQALARVSAKFYGYPAEELTVIGVTGTNGKTTTTYLIRSILKKIGVNTGLIGTIENELGNETKKARRTTPESLDLQRMLAQMLNQGVSHVVMEVSSHALKLDRVLGVDFDRQIFTNLTHDHLNFHQSIEDYLAAKAKLFQVNDQPAIINFDDQYATDIVKQAEGEIISYGLQEGLDFKAEDIKLNLRGANYKLSSNQEQLSIALNLTGKFNVYNSLAAIATLFSLGFDLTEVKSGLEQVTGVPGRFEFIDENQDFGVIVDYAHTPDGMEKLLQTVNELTAGQIIIVFGGRGDRDKEKRSIMGQLSIELADLAIITSDSPHSEESEAIIADIETGITAAVGVEGRDYQIIKDRREAIKQAIELAQPQDAVLITGRGHETWQKFGKQVVDFDDRQVARNALRRRED
ncbi:UDP-N-acetylmuramoyl-L-alanyl-D-glutamate--2,6-diaminopimelate ligase [Halanaerobaculum tunisiense]